MLSSKRLDEIEPLQAENSNLQINIRQLIEKNNTLNGLVIQKDAELQTQPQFIIQLQRTIEQLKNQNEQGENIYRTAKFELEDKIVQLTKENEFFQKKVNLLEQELQQASQRTIQIEQFGAKLQECEINNIQLRKKIEDLLQENALLKIKITDIEQEYNQYQIRMRELENISRKIQDYETSIRYLTEQNEHADQIAAQKDAEIQRMSAEVENLQNENKEEKVKKSRNQTNLEEAVRDKEEKLGNMIAQIEFMNKKQQQQEQELSHIRQRNAQLEQVLQNLDQLENKNQQLNITIERLNQMTNDKDQEMNRLRRENEELKKLLQQKEQIILQFRPLQEKLIECERNNVELRRKVEELLEQMNEEKVKKSKRENMSEKELIEIRAKLAELQDANQNLAQDNTRLQNFNRENEQLRKRFEKERNQIQQQYAQQNEQLVIRVKQLEQELISNKLIIESIRKQIIEWESTSIKINNYSSLVDAVKTQLSQQVQTVFVNGNFVRHSTQFQNN